MALNIPLLCADMSWLTSQKPECLTPEPVLVIYVLLSALRFLYKW